MLYYLSLGSNIGEREQMLREAVRLIEQQIGNILRCSSFYYSEPWGFDSKHEFCNLCCALETAKSPLEVLHLTQAIERQLQLRQPIYFETAAYGHMGREDLGVSWEKTDRVDALKAAVREAANL